MVVEELLNNVKIDSYTALLLFFYFQNLLIKRFFDSDDFTLRWSDYLLCRSLSLLHSFNMKVDLFEKVFRRDVLACLSKTLEHKIGFKFADAEHHM